MRLGFLLLCGLLAATAACATGAETDEDPYANLSTTGGGGDGYGGYGGDDSSSSTASAMGGMGGDMSGVGGSGAMGGMPPGCLYDSPNTCPTATALSAIAGDEGGPTITETGETSEWFKIHIEERVGSVFAEDLSYTVTLQNPANMDFDLYVLPGPEDGNPDCNANARQVTMSGNDESVHQSWNDDQGLGGEDDSRWLCIEVRYVSGMECGMDAEWTLTVQGHT